MSPTLQKALAGDARQLPAIASASVALVVTSPPYPMIGMWDELFCGLSPRVRDELDGGRGGAALELMHRELDLVWREVERLLVPGGIACINIGDATRSIGGSFALFANHARVVSSLGALGFQMLPAVLWRKPTNSPTKFMGSGMLPPGAYVTLEHERIIVARKGGPRPFASAEKRLLRRQSAYFWEERNRWFSDLWEFTGARQKLDGEGLRTRSGSFPYELAYRLVGMYSVREDAVLDPFLGAGTSLLATAALGRNGVGVDIDPSLVDHSTRRLLAARTDLNAHTARRLQAHIEFVQRCRQDQTELRYTNRAHGFPVMTGQETELDIQFISRLEHDAQGAVRVHYTPQADGDSGQLGLGLSRYESPEGD